jgi:uncharacterized protein YoxC
MPKIVAAVLLASFTWGDLAYLALAVFLFAVGLTLAYVFLRLAGTLDRVSSFILGTERELLPLLNKAGGTLDHVNDQLEKVDHMTDSAVDAVDTVDTAVRAVSQATTRPVQKATGFVAGVSHGFADLKVRRDWRGAVDTAKEAAARRERDFAEQLRREGADGERPAPGAGEPPASGGADAGA